MDKLDIEINLEYSGVSKNKIDDIRKTAISALDEIWSKKLSGSGWIDLPLKMTASEIERIENAAIYAQAACKKMIVIGIGGSFLGSKAAISALENKIQKRRESIGENYPFVEVEFAGTSLSAMEHKKYVDMVQKEDVMLCVISKSGNTLEVNAIFSILMEEMIAKLGKEEAKKRVLIITDTKEGELRKVAEEENYITLDIPEDVGGRYSVLTAVGLLPMAVMGIDIKQILAGAAAAAGSPRWDSDALDYAIVRNIYLNMGKRLEVFEVFEPALSNITLWLMQLFAESEGKHKKAIYPTSLEFTRDLHSLGQYLQEGSDIFFESIISVNSCDEDLVIPKSAGGNLGGRSLAELSDIAQKAVIKAHSEAGIPIVKISLPEISEYTIGEMFYFFETSCAVSALLQGVNPFDQPGVESYKKEMRELLK